jgi:hypothetical protein
MLERDLLDHFEHAPPDSGAARTLRDGDALDLGPVRCVRGAASDDLGHGDDVATHLGDDDDPTGVRNRLVV